MTGLFFLLAGLSLLVISVTGIWLLVLSFRTSVLWGLAVLLLPFAVVVFAIKYWDECKKPFLAYIGGTVATVVLLNFFIRGPTHFEIGLLVCSRGLLKAV